MADCRYEELCLRKTLVAMAEQEARVKKMELDNVLHAFQIARDCGLCFRDLLASGPGFPWFPEGAGVGPFTVQDIIEKLGHRLEPGELAVVEQAVHSQFLHRYGRGAVVHRERTGGVLRDVLRYEKGDEGRVAEITKSVLSRHGVWFRNGGWRGDRGDFC
jgi:hypothetical protein